MSKITGKPARAVQARSVAKAVATVTAVASVGFFAHGAAASVTDQGVIRYTISSSSTISGPSQIRPGLIKFQALGPAGHSLQLAQSRNGLGRKTLARDSNTLNSTGDPRPLQRDFRGVGGAGTGNSAYVTLKPGQYYVVDTGSQTTSAPKVRILRVTGVPSHAGGYPRNTPSLHAVHEMDWGSTPTRIHYRGYLRFANDSTDWHFVVLQHIKKGKTIADVRKALAGKEKESDVFYSGPKDSTDTAVISSKRSMTFSYDLNPGTYAVMCFWPDSDPPHTPHAMMGMVRSIHLVR